MAELRNKEYERLAIQNPEKYGQYLKGWKNRLGDVISTDMSNMDKPTQMVSNDNANILNIRKASAQSVNPPEYTRRCYVDTSNDQQSQRMRITKMRDFKQSNSGAPQQAFDTPLVHDDLGLGLVNLFGVL